MKRIISLLLCLVLLVSAVPALAASLTPEDVIGTWKVTKEIMGKEVRTEKQMTWSVIRTFNADGTGKKVFIDSFGKKSILNYTWSIEGNTVKMNMPNGLWEMKKSGRYLLSVSESVQGETIKEYYKKTKDTTDKIIRQAFLSAGSYKLNPSKKTAIYTGMGFTKCTSVKIPDTIKAQGLTFKVVGVASKALSGNLLITSVTLGKNIKTIGAGAFAGCTNLKKVTFKGTALTKIGANAFTGIKDNATVTCPKAKLSKYQKLLKKAGLPKTATIKAK